MMRWLALTAVLGCASRLHAAEKLNVILVVADDLGQRDLGCYGSKYYRTPHIDRLAQHGVRFTDAYAACPVCSPTRAALMTGRYPARLNLTDWLPGRPDRPDQKLSRPAIVDHLPDVPTLPAAFKTAGYATALMGKWHLGGAGHEPQRYGFDVNVAGDHSGTPKSYFAPFAGMPGLESAPAGEYLTDRLAAEACRFITANKDRPFFLYLPHYAPHTPLKAKPEVVAKYPGPKVAGKQSNPVYAAMVEGVDDAVGRVVAALDELKLADRTVVVFTSDNGGLATTEGGPTGATFNGPLREGKGFLYEGGVRVPLIVRGPGAKPGTTTNAVVSSYDLFPTLLGLGGLSAPKSDGVDFAAALKGEPFDRGGPLFWHYPHYSNQGGKPGSAIRSGNWKMIEFAENVRRELFDLKTDPGESNNLAADRPDVVADLAGKLAAWRAGVGAKAMTPNPAYRPNPQAADGTMTLHARTAEVSGAQLRFEPLPHKNTLGFWTRKDDTARWEFELTKPGTFAVEVLQGCGKGSGGSEVEFDVAGRKLTYTVKDTGGFQQFEVRPVGTVTLDTPGRLTLTVTPKSKPGAAVMDLRQVTLTPVKP
jgi:arylsulfatase A